VVVRASPTNHHQNALTAVVAVWFTLAPPCANQSVAVTVTAATVMSELPSHLN